MIFSQKMADRYNELKQEVPNCILLMQIGAFKKVMNEDAQKISDLTGLKLQVAGDVEYPVIVGGFPKTGQCLCGQACPCRTLCIHSFPG